MDAVCDRVAALHRLPRLAPVALGRLFPPGNTADGGRVKDNLRAHERNRSRGFREPLVVADEHGNAAVLGIVDPVAVSGQEIGLLVKERIVGDVHLPVGGEEPAVGIDHYGGVVVLAGRSPLVDRHDDHGVVLPGECREGFGRRPRDRLGVAGSVRILVLREVGGGAVEFLQAEDPRTPRDRRSRRFKGAFQVAVGGVLAHRRLDEADRLRAHLHHLSVSVGHSSVLYQPPGHTVIPHRAEPLRKQWSSRRLFSSPSGLRWMHLRSRSAEAPVCGRIDSGGPSLPERSSAGSRQECRCSGGSGGDGGARLVRRNLRPPLDRLPAARPDRREDDRRGGAGG